MRGQEERAAILESVDHADPAGGLQPGGDNFELAVKKLNHYFEGTNPAEYQLESAAREYLRLQLPPRMVDELENRNWSLRDTRHIEDCMMYYGIANRVAGTGEDLAQVRRVFDWVVRQIQLVPAGSLRAGRLPHAYARPYDVLLRGMATEAEGFWAERAWLFIALCRQLGIDAGLITYTKNNTLDALDPEIRRRSSRSRRPWLVCGRTEAADRLDLRGPDRRQGLPVRRPARPGNPRARRSRRGDARRGHVRPGDPRADEPAGPRALWNQPRLAPGQPDQDRHPDRLQPRAISHPR